jgi:hypothetical protein
MHSLTLDADRPLPRLEVGATVCLPSGRTAVVLEVYLTGRRREILLRPEDDDIAFRIRACHLTGV